jgi:hypothetical protein
MRLLLAPVVLAACTTHGSTTITGDDCGDRGCASFPGTLTLTVTDSTTQQPVAGTLTFTDPSGALPFTCSVAIDPATTPCPSWQLMYEGAFDVTVSAPSYQPGTIHVVIEGPAACCGAGPATSASLALVPL